MEIIATLETLHLEYPWNDGFMHKKDIHYFLAKLIDDEREGLVKSHLVKCTNSFTSIISVVLFSISF